MCNSMILKVKKKKMMHGLLQGVATSQQPSEDARCGARRTREIKIKIKNYWFKTSLQCVNVM